MARVIDPARSTPEARSGLLLSLRDAVVRLFDRANGAVGPVNDITSGDLSHIRRLAEA